MGKSTDVKHSIAGYYYQLLLATRELLFLAKKSNNQLDYVAIEKGSDVRVSTQDNSYIEAKFYKVNSFTKAANAIRHTIFNFYNDYKKKIHTRDDIPNYCFVTNVPIATKDEEFFKKWTGRKIIDYTEYIKYIKECLVYEYIKKEKSEEFQEYKKKNPIKGLDLEKSNDSKYYLELFKYLQKNPNEYKVYADPDMLDDDDIERFIERFTFEFSPTKSSKEFSIIKIKKDIFNLIEEYDSSVTKDELNHICNLIMEDFFNTTILENSSEVTLKRMKQLFREKHEQKLEFLNNVQLKIFIDAMKENMEDYKNYLDEAGFEDKDDVMALLIHCQEQLFGEMDISGVEEVARRYVMDSNFNSPNLVIQMLQTMCEVAVSSQEELGEISLKGLKGLNNFSHKDNKEYCLKGTSSRYARFLQKFIHNVEQYHNITELCDTQTVIFESNKRCDINKNLISSIVLDISDASVEFEKRKMLYDSLEYRCNYCLKRDSDIDDCEFAKKIRGESI